MQHSQPTLAAHARLRKTAIFVAALNLVYFGVEFFVGRAIGSVSLFADSIDFLEDASVNILILLAVGFSAFYRRLVGMAFVGLLLIPSVAALYTVWDKLAHPTLSDPLALSVTAFGALLVNGTCAFLLARVRNSGGSLSKAAFLSARNDMAANVAMLAAGGLTAYSFSIWPDILVGLGIAALNATAAWEVYEAACAETAPVEPTVFDAH